MLQIQRTEKTDIQYRVNPVFAATRKCAETVDRIQLATDLLKIGHSNVARYNEGQKMRRAHVHVLNANNVYVTIIITEQNKLTLRGKMYTRLNDLFAAIDTYRN